MTFPAAVTMRDVDNVFFGGHIERRYFAEDGPQADFGVWELKDGVLQLRDYALSVLVAELPCALLPEMVAGPNADDVLELRKQNASCYTPV